MIGRVLSNDVDDAGMRLLRIVQIGETVGEARAEMQQSRGRFSRHAVISIRCARHDA